jgi:hypothetical protein
MEPIAQRIYDYLFKYKGFKNDTVVAKELGYSHPEKISRLFRTGSGAKPSVDILEDITKKFGEELNIEWVIIGKGEMIKQVTNSLVFNDNIVEYGKKAAHQKPPLESINAEIERIRLSLEKVQRSAQELTHSGTGKGRVSERAPLGKTRGSIGPPQKSEPKGSDLKKGK